MSVKPTIGEPMESIGITTHPTAESSSHSHQVHVIQFVFRSVVQLAPPEPKAGWRLPPFQKRSSKQHGARSCNCDRENRRSSC